MKNLIIIATLCALSLHTNAQSVQRNSKQNAKAVDKSGPIFVTSPTSNTAQAVDLSDTRSGQVRQQSSAVAIPAVSLDNVIQEIPANKQSAKPVTEQTRTVPNKTK